MTRNCDSCGAVYSRPEWMIGRFCSRACFAVAARVGETVACGYCDGPFHVHAKKVGRIRFCSPECRKLGKTTLVDCQKCGTAFRVKPYRAEAAKYCTVACKAAAQDFGKTPETLRIRASPPMREWRKAVFARDDYTCQGCGQHGGWLEADHIKPFAQFPELRFDLANGRTLCKPCHRQTPTFGGRSRRTVTPMLAG